MGNIDTFEMAKTVGPDTPTFFNTSTCSLGDPECPFLSVDWF